MTATVEVRGGVAHLSGKIPSREQQSVLRRLVVGVRGIHGIWDFTNIAGERPLRIVDLGCGDTKQAARAIGLDAVPGATVDLVADLRCGLPFQDDSVDAVFAVHVLEHVAAELPALMAEIHRVVRWHGLLHVIVPHWRFVNAVADPTHVRFFDAQTFKYFCRPGRAAFCPLIVSNSTDNVYADLIPVKNGNPPASEHLLARFFD